MGPVGEPVEEAKPDEAADEPVEEGMAMLLGTTAAAT